MKILQIRFNDIFKRSFKVAYTYFYLYDANILIYHPIGIRKQIPS